MPATRPEALDALFEHYLNAGQVDALVELYEPAAVFVPQPGAMRVGHAAIRNALEAFVTARPRLQLHVTQVISSGDLAILYTDWAGTVTDADGATQSIAGRALEVARRQADGTWRFVVDDPYARG